MVLPLLRPMIALSIGITTWIPGLQALAAPTVATINFTPPLATAKTIQVTMGDARTRHKRQRPLPPLLTGKEGMMLRMITTIGENRKRRGLLIWLVAALTLLIGVPANLSIPAAAAPPPDQPPVPGAIRVLALDPDNSTGAAGMIGGVGQPWLSNHELLHFRHGLLYRYDVAANVDTPLTQLTRQVKTSACFLYFLDASPNGQQVIWGMSANNPIFVATVDGARREQWDGNGGMTQPFWCADGKHWMQFHFGGNPESLRWTKIQMHSLDAPHASQTFPSAPPGLNGLDILAAPSADRIIARMPDHVEMKPPKSSAGVSHPDGSVSFTFQELPTFRKAQTISVWSLRQAQPLHRYAISLPGWVQEVTVSPNGERAAWLLTKVLGAGARASVSLWASGVDGSGLHRIGDVRVRARLGNSPLADFASQLHWVPGDEKVSFLYGDALWTVAAD